MNVNEVFWFDPHNLDALIEAEKYGLRKTRFRRALESIPSFSLGLTQPEPEQNEARLIIGEVHKSNEETKHMYVIRANLKTQKIDNLDNSSAKGDRYGKMAENIRDMVLEYVKYDPLDAKGAMLRNVKQKRLLMTRRDEKNTDDYGIYCMRHMKTYKGEGVQAWECGLKKNDRRQIASLRLKYIADMLCADVNELKTEVLMRARDYEKKKKEEKKAGNWKEEINNI
ncbi:unnamed protein product [Cuscuta europaea]|uniref:Uncharacterized protein n=1 Tax=Cuscuta europaea TaxID=41803 RepID=A0A9P0YNF4_CUSEU|nr:unnamed protein product [Cuscuta europaea]